MEEAEEVEEVEKVEEVEEAEDWLAHLRTSTVEEAEEVEEVEPSEALAEPIEPVDMPDWLQDRGPLTAETPPTPGEMQPSAELPDWLREFTPPEATAPEAPPPAREAERAALEEVEEVEEETPPPPVPADIPDWLRKFAPPEVVAPETPPSPEAELEEMEELAEVEELEEEGEALPAPALAELPDWLRELASPEVPEVPLPEAPPPVPEAELEEVEEPAEVEELEQVEEPAEIEELEEEEEAVAAPVLAEIPDWLRELTPSEAITPEAPPPAPEAEPAKLEKMEEPTAVERLAPAPLETAPSPPLMGFPAEVEELAPAEIPDWLEALRPQPAEAEVVAREEPVETEGLLEGLGGVLAPTLALEPPAIHERRRPPEVSEASLARAQLLQGLLTRAAEAPPPTPVKRRARIGRQIERWLVTIVLLAAVVSPLVAPLFVPANAIPHLTQPASQSMAAGRMDFQRLVRMYDTVQDVGTGDTVLVAFEYGPSEADEVNLVAEPVLRHLLDRGAHLSVVSTRPEGRTVAAGLLSTIVTTGAPYTRSQYTLQDYRPGDAAGVAMLLRDAGPLPALILVLTAQPGPLRWWVEQIHARYDDAPPVLAGTSAALEPAASPYLETSAGQLNGAVSGLSGAAAYETLRGSRGQATHRLGALSLGHTATAALMLLGALFYAFAGLRRRGSNA